MMDDAPEGAIAIDQRIGGTAVRGDDAADEDAVRAGIEPVMQLAFEDGGGIGDERQPGLAVAPVMVGEIEGAALARAPEKVSA